jgi:hypothetical protein
LADEDYPQGEEDDSEEDDSDPEEAEERTVPALIATKAVLRSLSAGVRVLRTGSTTDQDQADEVVETMTKQGYSMSGYEFTSET